MMTIVRHLTTLVMVGLISAIPAQANEIEPFEVPARQTAIRILETLKPIDAYVEEIQTSSDSPSVTREIVEITGSRVNLRSAPNLESTVIRSAREGERFAHISTEGNWRQVRVDGGTLYVSAEYSRVREENVSGGGTAKTVQRLRPGSEKRVSGILSSVARDYKRLNLLHDEAEARFESEYGNLPDGRVDRERDEARESLGKIRKYQRLVSQYYERYSEMAGGVEPQAAQEPAWSPQFSGTVAGGFGTNTAKIRSGGATVSETDVSRSNLDGNVTADLSPNDQLNVQFGRTEEIRFAPSTRARARGAYTRRFAEKGRFTAHGGLSSYRNDADDTGDMNRNEFGVQGVITPSPAFRATGGAAITSIAYPNNDVRDVSDTRLELGAGGELSPSVQWNTAYRHLAHAFDDAANVDNSQGYLEGSLIFETGALSAIIIEGNLESNSFDQNADPREYSRHGLKLASRSRSVANVQSEFSFEWRGKSYETNGDRDFTEFRGGYRSREYSTRADRQTELRVNYRNYSGDMNAALLDYIEGRIETKRDRGRDRSTSLFSEGDLYVQYFFENNKIKRNALITQYAWLGLSTGGNLTFKIGPHFATNTELVVVDNAVGPDGEDLGTFESPNNTFRYGAKAEFLTRERPLRARLAARYEVLNMYNVDGAPTQSRIELQGEGTYSISRQIDASAAIKLYSTGADDPGVQETSETDILVGLIYHLGSSAR